MPATYPTMERLLRGVEPEARSRDLTQAEKAQAFLEEQLAKITSKERARKLSMTAFGGAESGIPGGMGAVDFVPFLGSAKGLEEGGRDIRQGNYDLESGRYGDAARNYGAAVLGVLPGAVGAVKVAPGLAKAIKGAAQDEVGALSKPLTKKQFEKQFAQHIDIRGRENKNQEENIRAILEEGFRRGFGPNAVPPYAGGAPLNIMSERFQPRSGDVVYLAPQSAWQKTPNGMQIVEGWKPEPQNIIRVKDPNQSMYEAYLANFNKPKAPQDEALRLAQQRAALPPSQGGLGLPANNTPMQRAKAMKYVDEGFHETEGANIESGLSSFDVRRGGAGSSDEQTPYAMFIKTHPAGIGVARKNPAQMPVLLKSNLTDENILRAFANRDELQKYLNQFPEIKESTKAVRDLDKEMANQLEELTKKADKLDAEGRTKEADKIYNSMESDSPLIKEFYAKMSGLTGKSKDQITDLFKSQGIGTVGLTNDAGAFGRNTNALMVLNPNENVRSRFAAFDPFRRDAATAAAFGVAAPDLLAKEKTEEPPKKKKRPEGALSTVTK